MKLLNLLYKKYKRIFNYLLFGVFTTLVNIVMYWMCAHLLACGIMLSTVVAWFGAVSFAYITNRRWVFNSEARTAHDLLKELVAFFSCRIATGFVDWIAMFIFADLLKINDVIIKIIANVIVIVLNYVASKLIIFRGKRK